MGQPDSRFHLGGLRDRLQRLPFALTLSDTTLPDAPLIFLNTAFAEMTGYGDEVLGTNCRFLQGDLENEGARAEVRNTLDHGGRVQVVLRNVRKNKEFFYNMLLLEVPSGKSSIAGLAIGSQFDLGSRDAENDPAGGARFISPGLSETLESVMSRADQIKMERRRVMTQATIRLLESWFTLSSISRN